MSADAHHIKVQALDNVVLTCRCGWYEDLIEDPPLWEVVATARAHMERPCPYCGQTVEACGSSKRGCCPDCSNRDHPVSVRRHPIADEFPVPRVAMLGIWLALGGDCVVFEEWIDDHRRTPADAWAQLLAAIEADWAALTEDTNPPAGELLDLANGDLRIIRAIENNCSHPAQSTETVDHRRYGEVCADCLFLASDVILALRWPEQNGSPTQ